MSKKIRDMSDAQLKARLKKLFDQINYKEREAREIQRKSSPITGRRSLGAEYSKIERDIAQREFNKLSKELDRRQGKKPAPKKKTIDEVVRPIDRSPKAQRERMIRARQKPAGGAAATRKAAPALKVAPVVKKAEPAKPAAPAPKAEAKPKKTMRVGKPGFNRRTVEKADSTKISEKRQRRRAGKYVGARQDMVDRLLAEKMREEEKQRQVVKKKYGGKGRGMGKALRGGGKVMD